MKQPPILRPRPGTLACANCTAWSHWDHIAVGQDGPGGFRIIGQKPTGQCRASPPTINSDAIGSETAMWPVVGSEDWCRQFEMRDQHEEAA